MKKIASLRHPVILVLLPAFLLLAVGHSAIGQDQQKGEGGIENAKWALQCDMVIITYDLVANPDIVYDVNIVLKKESDKVFKIVPRSVTGSIGKGKYAGTKREIRWEYRKDLSDNLLGDDYYFEFTASKEEGISNVWYYVIGGIVGTGGIAALTLLKSKPGVTNAQTTSGLPGPPSQSQPTSR